MKILYGVCGEGMGHARCSDVVARHLASRGHSIQFVSSSGRALQYLAKRWPGKVVSCVGLSMVMDKNALMPVSTFALNVLRQAIASPLLHFVSAFQVGKPDVVISDFCPWSARYANLLGIPLIAVNNIHFIDRCTHPREVVAGDRQAAALAYPIVASMVPNARRYLVATFVGAQLRAPNTSLHMPLLQPEIFGVKRGFGDHVFVYFNDKADHQGIVNSLRNQPALFKVYGTKTDVEYTVDNVTLCPFSDNFIRDLANSRAVIGGAGFSLICEAIFLGKPMLALPFGGQFEQILNSNYLGYVGYGERARSLDAGTISRFLANVPRYRENLASYRHDGNRELLASVEQAIHGC
jgi:uncharacterized protein (TIGR00661 family)